MTAGAAAAAAASAGAAAVPAAAATAASPVASGWRYLAPRPVAKSLVTYLSSASAARPHWLTGPRGTGKSSLLRHVVAQLPETCAVISVDASSAGSDVGSAIEAALLADVMPSLQPDAAAVSASLRSCCDDGDASTADSSATCSVEDTVRRACEAVSSTTRLPLLLDLAHRSSLASSKGAAIIISGADALIDDPVSQAVVQQLHLASPSIPVVLECDGAAANLHLPVVMQSFVPPHVPKHDDDLAPPLANVTELLAWAPEQASMLLADDAWPASAPPVSQVVAILGGHQEHLQRVAAGCSVDAILRDEAGRVAGLLDATPESDRWPLVSLITQLGRVGYAVNYSASWGDELLEQPAVQQLIDLQLMYPQHRPQLLRPHSRAIMHGMQQWVMAQHRANPLQGMRARWLPAFSVSHLVYSSSAPAAVS